MKRKAIFELVRRMMGRGFTAAEVRDLDARLDAMTAKDAVPEPPVDTVREVFDPTTFVTQFANVNASKITAADIAAAARKLNVTSEHIQAIIAVESGGKSFDNRGRPVILFEPHIFHRRTKGRWSPSSFSYRKWRTKPYPRTFDGRWAQMAQAADRNIDAALESASWGAFQIMGFHWKALGYPSAIDMAEAMASSEGAHLDAVVRFIEANGLATKLRQCRAGSPASCVGFVKAYNGGGYAKNRYHIKFAKALR